MLLKLHPGRSCCPVVTVGDVEQRHLLEGLDDFIALHETPDGMPYPVGRREIVQCRPLYCLSHESIDPPCSPVGEQQGPCMGREREHVSQAVILLVLTCMLVFAYPASLILFHRTARSQANLFVPSLTEPVDIERRLFLLYENPILLEPCIIIPCLFIYHISAETRSFRKIDLRSDDVEKAQRVSPGQSPGLHGCDHIIGNARHILCPIREGSKCPERPDHCHMSSPLLLLVLPKQSGSP